MENTNFSEANVTHNGRMFVKEIINIFISYTAGKKLSYLRFVGKR